MSYLQYEHRDENKPVVPGPDTDSRQREENSIDRHKDMDVDGDVGMADVQIPHLTDDHDMNIDSTHTEEPEIVVLKRKRSNEGSYQVFQDQNQDQAGSVDSRSKRVKRITSATESR